MSRGSGVSRERDWYFLYNSRAAAIIAGNGSFVTKNVQKAPAEKLYILGILWYNELKLKFFPIFWR